MLYSRVKKELRTGKVFVKDDNVLVYGKLAKAFLEKAVEMPLNIVEAEEEYSKEVLNKEFKEYDKVVIPFTADDEADLFYNEITSKNPDFGKIGHSKFVKIFKPVLDKELVQAAKILDIEFKTVPKSEEIEKIHKKYPTSKFGLVKTASEFKKIIKWNYYLFYYC